MVPIKRHGMASGSIRTTGHQQLAVKHLLTHEKANNALHFVHTAQDYELFPLCITWCFCNSLMLLIAHFTVIWTLSTMYVLAFIETAVTDERLITNITGVWTLSQYVCLDVSSGLLYYW